jgi:hypothetical protein
MVDRNVSNFDLASGNNQISRRERERERRKGELHKEEDEEEEEEEAVRVSLRPKTPETYR